MKQHVRTPLHFACKLFGCAHISGVAKIRAAIANIKRKEKLLCAPFRVRRTFEPRDTASFGQLIILIVPLLRASALLHPRVSATWHMARWMGPARIAQVYNFHSLSLSCFGATRSARARTAIIYITVKSSPTRFACPKWSQVAAQARATTGVPMKRH